MKPTAKVLSALLILFALFSVIPQMAVFAAGQDGITLSVETDKESYESGQEIDVTVTVKNTNDYEIIDVSVTVELPEGLRLVSGDLSVSDITLQSGESYQRTVKAMKSGETDPTESTTSTTEPTESTTLATEPTTTTEPTQIGPVKPTAPTFPTKQTSATKPTTPTTQKSSKPSGKADDSHEVSPKTGEMSLAPFWMMVFIMPIIAAAALITIRKQQYYAQKAICLPAKSVISLALVLCLGFGMMPANVLAAGSDDTDASPINLSEEKTITVDGEECVIRVTVTGTYQKTEPTYTIREKEDGTVAVTGYTGSESALTIPASIDGKKVSEIGDSAFAGLLCLKTVRVPEGVTHIGNYAFECCSLLRKIYLPESLRYKGEVIPHYVPMTAVQNRDPAMWAEAASTFGDDFEQLYLMMDHGLFTELARGKMEEPLILYSGLYDSQLMAAAGTDVLPTQQQLVDAIGSTFTDPIMISTTTDPGIAAGFGDTLFIIYASPEALEGLGAVCIDAVVHSQEKEILMNHNARYRILDVGNMAIQHQNPWEDEPTTLYRHYVKVELLKP